MKKLLLSLLILSLLVVTACKGDARLQNMDTRVYSNVAGYHLTLPADWLLLEEEEESSIFSAAQGDISLTVFNELGGEAYYGLGEITDMLLAQLPETGRPWQSERLITDTDVKHRQLFNNIDGEGATVFLDITVRQPYPGIRYYLLFATSSATYDEKNALLNDILTSFVVDENRESLYALMKERREKKAEEQQLLDELQSDELLSDEPLSDEPQ